MGLLPALGPDAAANDTTLWCGNPPRPPNEAEPSIAAWGPYVLTSYNDGASRCLTGFNGSQGHAYSVDFGATFRDGGLLAGPTSNDVFHGDPTVAVNSKTGDFYISGLLRQRPNVISGVVALKGHFAGGAFVIDVRRIVALAQGDDFLDKSWMAADSLSGNVYITWTNFRADGVSQIEMQRCDGELNPLGALQVVYAEPDFQDYGVQGSYPTVGPRGELYIPWTRYTATFSGVRPDFQIVRSDDFGVTFGPVRTFPPIDADLFSGGPGSRRGFGSADVAMAVDRSDGPHRGRAYMVWDQSLPYEQAPFSEATAGFDGPTDDFFASATLFVPGGKLRGSVGGLDRDVFAFTGRRGDTFVMRKDTLTSFGGMSLRILCPADTSSLASWRTLVLANAFQGALCGLPYDGTYYVVLGATPPQTTANGIYAYSTAMLSPPPGAVVRDNREQMLSHSDDGITWSPPVRLNDSESGIAGSFPSVAVDGLGRVHCSWLDWRSGSDCGDVSNVYMTSSGDGGVTWGANRRVSDASSYWSFLASLSGANQGDYIQMTAEGVRVYSSFPDSRMNNPDVFVDASEHRSLVVGPTEASVTAGRDTVLQMSLTNGGNFETPLAWRLEESAGWMTGASPGVSGSRSLPPGGTIVVEVSLLPPHGSGGQQSSLLFMTSDPHIPGREDSLRVVLHSEAPTCVAARVRLLPGVLHGRGKRGWVTAVVQPPSPFTTSDIDVSSIRLESARGSIAPDPRAPSGRRGDEDENEDEDEDDAELRVRFSRAAVLGLLEERSTELTLTGTIAGRCFEGRVTVRGWGGRNSAEGGPGEGLSFALHGVRPNPVVDAIRVGFTLPDASPAVLALFDVGGRRVAMREVGQLGAGRHTVTLSPNGLSPGIYIVRLTRAGVDLTARWILMR